LLAWAFSFQGLCALPSGLLVFFIIQSRIGSGKNSLKMLKVFSKVMPNKSITLNRKSGTFIRIKVTQNANDRGWFVVIKTRLTTKGRRECKEKGDYIHIIKG
jgi:hypothetical protein